MTKSGSPSRATTINEAHTLVEIARRTVWSAESDPENPDEPSARMRQILDHLDLAHAAIDTIIDEVEGERDGTMIGPREGSSRTIIH